METSPHYLPTLQGKAGTPAYQCMAYKAALPVWTMLGDLYQGSEAWLGRDEDGAVHATTKGQIYLPREPAEETDNYVNRLGASPFDDRFAQSLRKFVGLVLANPLVTELSSKVLEQLPKLGADGSSFVQMTKRIAIAALRDGHTFVLVDYPKTEGTIRSQADYLASGHQPTWAHYGAIDVPYWVTETRAGRTVLMLAVLREHCTVSGLFQEAKVTRYRVLSPGAWALYEEQIKDGKATYPVVESGEFSVPGIPLVCVYGGLKTGFYQSQPPLKSLADLNLVHYRVKSDHLRKIHLCCMPVPVLVDSMRSDDDPLVIGPNSFLHIKDPGGSFFWSEPLATSIEQSRREVLDLEGTMDILAASYLENPSDRQAALTTTVQTKQLESSLIGFASSLTEGFNECFQVHAAYLGIKERQLVTFSGEIIVERGNDSQLLMAYTNLFVSAVISRRSLLEWMANGGYLPEGFDIEAEIKAVEATLVQVLA